MTKPTKDDFTLLADRVGHVIVKCDLCRERQNLGQSAYPHAATAFVKRHMSTGCTWKD